MPGRDGGIPVTTLGERRLISTIYDRLLIADDTEESVSGSDFHLAAILALYDVLLRYARRMARRWYVTAEVMVLVDVPDRSRNPWRPMPDVYVVLDTDDTPRTSLDTRIAGQPFPQFICEVASESTWREDIGEKRRLYADLGAREYVVFDPTAQFLGQPIRAWRRREDGTWGEWEQDAHGFLTSAVLGLRLRAEDNLPRRNSICSRASRPTSWRGSARAAWRWRRNLPACVPVGRWASSGGRRRSLTAFWRAIRPSPWSTSASARCLPCGGSMACNCARTASPRACNTSRGAPRRACGTRGRDVCRQGERTWSILPDT